MRCIVHCTVQCMSTNSCALCKCVSFQSIYGYCTVYKLQNLYCTVRLIHYWICLMPFFPKNSIDSISLKTQLEIAKIELNENFSLSNIKFVVNQFNYPLIFTNYYNFH